MDRIVGAPLDLVHSPHPLLIPAKKAKHIVTLHDLFFLKHPDMTEAEIRRDYAPLVRDHVRRADGVICVSEHTASEARLLLDVPPAKIAVIPNGIDPAYRLPIAAEAGGRRAGPPRPAARAPSSTSGSEEKRKNLVNLAMAYIGLAGAPAAHAAARAGRPGPGVGAGRDASAGPQIRATGLPGDARDPRAHGRVGGAGAALAGGGLRPARGGGHGGRACPSSARADPRWRRSRATRPRW